jgi:hypothetical protein
MVRANERRAHMAKYVMVVQSKAAEGRDDDYNAWYDSTHLADICALPGVKSGKRFDYAMSLAGGDGAPYLALYEVETDDVGALAAELGKRSMDGTIRQTDSLDGPASVLWFYKER